MSLQIQPCVDNEVNFDREWIERIILNLTDAFHVRIKWNTETAILTGAFALAGGLVGGYAGGRLGAALGAGVGGVTGLGVSMVVSLREIWEVVKERLKGLAYIVFNYLRRLEPSDYLRAYDILSACARSRRELVTTIVSFIAHELNKEVFSSISSSQIRSPMLS